MEPGDTVPGSDIGYNRTDPPNVPQAGYQRNSFLDPNAARRQGAFGVASPAGAWRNSQVVQGARTVVARVSSDAVSHSQHVCGLVGSAVERKRMARC